MANQYTKTIDLTGQRFGKLQAIKFVGVKNQKRKWQCLCDCGKLIEVATGSLRSGRALSCGCNRCQTHGMTKSPEYKIWIAMKTRCLKKNCKSYKNYGGRGIGFSESWLNFENFIADMGLRPSPDLTLERINNDGNYEKSNCEWATPKTQARNRRDTRLITYDGETLCLKDWAIKLKIDKGTLWARLKNSSTKDAFTRPVRKWTR